MTEQEFKDARNDVSDTATMRFNMFANGFEGRRKKDLFPILGGDKPEYSKSPKCVDVVTKSERKTFLFKSELDSPPSKPSTLCTGESASNEGKCTLVACFTPKVESGRWKKEVVYWANAGSNAKGVKDATKKPTQGNPKPWQDLIYHVEHIKDKSKGGPNSFSNYVFTWGRLNKGNNVPEYWDKVYGKRFLELVGQVKDWCNEHVLKKSITFNNITWHHIIRDDKTLDPSHTLFKYFNAKPDTWKEIVVLGRKICERGGDDPGQPDWYMDPLNAELYP